MYTLYQSVVLVIIFNKESKCLPKSNYFNYNYKNMKFCRNI